MAAPTKKPTALKAISGTVRPCRLPDEPAIALPALDEPPPAPNWLPNAHAVQEWNRLARILAANHLLTEGGLSALANLCALHGKLVQLWAAGESPTANMLGQYRSLVNDFGLTPVSQGRVKPVTGEQSANKFANNGKRERAA